MNSTASKLDALIGLDAAKRALLRLCEVDSKVHAVLFYGARGAGKQAHAKCRFEPRDPAADRALALAQAASGSGDRTKIHHLAKRANIAQ